MRTVDLSYIREHMPPRPDDAHKGSMGTLMSITGSRGYSGAAILSSKAALRSGVGLLYQVLPAAVYPPYAAAVHESVCLPLSGNEAGTLGRADADTILGYTEKASAVLIGCGMGNNADTRALLGEVIRNSRVPLIIDADGLNALAYDTDLLFCRNAEVILTPHPREFSRLSRMSTEEVAADPISAAEDFCRRFGDVTLVLKSHRTVIMKNGEGFLNTAGNSGMAKGGSGDVLAGIIASLTAQGASPYEAAVMGVHIHALAGDRAAEALSKTAMLPSDIIDRLPDIFKRIESP